MKRLILAGLAFLSMGVGSAFATDCSEIGHHGCCYPCGGKIWYFNCGYGCAKGPLVEAPCFHPQWYLEYPCPGEWYNQGVNPWYYFGATAADYGCAQPDVSNRPYYWYSK